MGYHAMLDVRNKHAVARERLIAGAIKETAAELRLVDVVDLIAFLRLDLMGNIADLVESASQLYLAPGTLRFAHGGDIRLNWGQAPEIDLDMEFRASGIEVHFRLGLTATRAAVEITYLVFEAPHDEPETNTERLRLAIEAARLVPGRPAADPV